MRPLPDLTPLETQPEVYDSSTDNFLTVLGSDYSAIDSLLNTATGEQKTVAGGVGSIAQTIDNLSSGIDAATTALDSLSADLNSVNLVPDILEYQAADSALDNGLNLPTFDFAEAASFFTDYAGNIIYAVEGYVISILNAALQSVYNAINDLLTYILGLIGL